METLGRCDRGEKVDGSALGIALVEFGVRCGSERIHAVKQLFTCGIGGRQRGVDRDGPEPLLLVTSERDPPEVVIDTIPRHDAEDALVRGCVPLDLFRDEDDERLKRVAGEGVEPASWKLHSLRTVGRGQLTEPR